jgi:hypothetical protein
MRPSGRILAATVLGAGLLAAACASGGDASVGTHTLEAVVVERSNAPGSGASNPAGSPNYYLVFETHEGQATARYRYEVTPQQWFRFPEGSRVKITLRNQILLNIQPND